MFCNKQIILPHNGMTPSRHTLNMSKLTRVLVDGTAVDTSVAQHFAAGVQFVCRSFQSCSLCCLFVVNGVAVGVDMLRLIERCRLCHVRG